MIHDRLKSQLERQQSEDQYGFRPGRSTTQALFALEQVIGKSLEWNVPAWIISIDLRKAFDRVDRTLMFQTAIRDSQPAS